MTTHGHFIGGKRIAGAGGRASDVWNPTTGEVQAQVALASRAEGPRGPDDRSS